VRWSTLRELISHHDAFENTVASIVDITSVMIAYTIGIQQSSILLGLAYGVFDAVIVVWMRKPITRFIRFALLPRSRRGLKADVYVADA
jgi:hypothetical protein